MSSISSFLVPQKKEGERGSGGRKAGTLICIPQAADSRPHGCLGIYPYQSTYITHTLRKTPGWDLSNSHPGAPWVQCLGVSCRAWTGKVREQSLLTAWCTLGPVLGCRACVGKVQEQSLLTHSLLRQTPLGPDIGTLRELWGQPFSCLQKNPLVAVSQTPQTFSPIRSMPDAQRASPTPLAHTIQLLQAPFGSVENAEFCGGWGRGPPEKRQR